MERQTHFPDPSSLRFIVIIVPGTNLDTYTLHESTSLDREIWPTLPSFTIYGVMDTAGKLEVTGHVVAKHKLVPIAMVDEIIGRSKLPKLAEVR